MLRRLLQMFLFTLLLSSCASVSVRKTERLVEKPPDRLPDKIFVRPLEFNESNLRVDRGGDNLSRFKFELQEKFTRNLVKRLAQNVAPAQAVAATAPLPRGNFWMVTGRFDRVYQGSRLLRSVFGFGAGGTKLETTVVVHDLSGRKPQAFFLVETTGGSGASPGAIGTAGYFVTGVTALGSLSNAIEGVRAGLTFDTIRTTREVNAAISEYLHQQKAISEENALAPKRLGKTSIPRLPFWSKTPARKGSIQVDPASGMPSAQGR